MREREGLSDRATRTNSREFSYPTRYNSSVPVPFVPSSRGLRVQTRRTSGPFQTRAIALATTAPLPITKLSRQAYSGEASSPDELYSLMLSLRLSTSGTSTGLGRFAAARLAAAARGGRSVSAAPGMEHPRDDTHNTKEYIAWLITYG